ncbi:MAG: hypothetical protein P8Z38_01745 [Robiginitalea sp.]
MTSAATGQESRSYKESFKVNPDVVVELNTSYADIEFDTWNRDEVVVEATIELEGATAEEARAFFERDGVEILGNSQEVQIRTQADRWAYRFSEPMEIHMEDIDVVIPEMPDIAPMVEEIMIQIPEIAELPPLPPLPPAPFDYEAYQKDGEKYMKEWQKKFEKEFDEEYRERFEAWGREMEARAKEMESRVKEREAQRAEMQKELEKERAALAEQRDAVRDQARKAREQALQAREQAREQALQAREEAREKARQSRVFYMRGPHGDQNFSIKKTIRIKMPKGARLKLNVRHGEVKLADNALNTKATLSYARLLATNIDGIGTEIEARYTPVIVKSWKDGSLQADYSEEISLSEVGQLKLQANSSDVTIERLLKRATIDNRFGVLQIGSVADDFTDLVISLENGELSCQMPKSSYRITVSSDRSQVAYPDFIRWSPVNQERQTTRTGYHQAKDSGRSIVINAAFSEVHLQE